MKFTRLALLVLGFFSTTHSAHSFVAAEQEELQTCLNEWGKHPFDMKNLKFRRLSAKVKIMGFGKDLVDDIVTEKPELILVRSNVGVLTKNTMNLLNPNGWYCLKGKVTVLGKTEINLHCKAKLALANGDATVLGAGEEGKTGVTVLGSTRIVRSGCETQTK